MTKFYPHDNINRLLQQLEEKAKNAMNSLLFLRFKKRRIKSNPSSPKARIDKVFKKLARAEMESDRRLAEEFEFKMLGHLEEYRTYIPFPLHSLREVSQLKQALQKKWLAIMNEAIENFNEHPMLINHPVAIELFKLISVEHPLAPYIHTLNPGKKDYEGNETPGLPSLLEQIKNIEEIQKELGSCE